VANCFLACALGFALLVTAAFSLFCYERAWMVGGLGALLCLGSLVRIAMLCHEYEPELVIPPLVCEGQTPPTSEPKVGLTSPPSVENAAVLVSILQAMHDTLRDIVTNQAAADKHTNSATLPTPPMSFDQVEKKDVQHADRCRLDDDLVEAQSEMWLPRGRGSRTGMRARSPARRPLGNIRREK